MDGSWRQGSVEFDKHYAGTSVLARVPVLGGFVRRSLLDRQRRAIAFLENVGAKTILDIGCGTGRFAVEAAMRGARVFGYDVSAPALALARQAAESRGVGDRCTFVQGDVQANAYPPADAWFDLGCLQYLPSPEAVVERLAGVPHGFSCLPSTGHWIGPARFLYRSVLMRQPYRTYSGGSILSLFRRYEAVRFERVKLVSYVTVGSR